MGGGEKTEQATQKRRNDERKKGNVFKSQEIGTLLGLLAVIYTIQIFSSWILGALTYGMEFFWSAAATASTYNFASDSLRVLFMQGSLMYGVAALPALLVAGLVAIVATVFQTRGLVSFESIKPKFSKLSPINGFKRMFSLRGVVELLKSIIKVIILGYVIYGEYEARIGEIGRLMEMEFTQALFYCAEFVMDVVLAVALIFAFLALADYMYQRWQYERDLRMSKQEIKEEYKQLEGDPKIKAQIKQRQRQMAASRMMQNVPQADVVIRNPTHYAVALQYEPGKTTAPRVLAKGADLMALRIIRVAEENGITDKENKPLATRL